MPPKKPPKNNTVNPKDYLIAQLHVQKQSRFGLSFEVSIITRVGLADKSSIFAMVILFLVHVHFKCS